MGRDELKAEMEAIKEQMTALAESMAVCDLEGQQIISEELAELQRRGLALAESYRNIVSDQREAVEFVEEFLG